MYAVSTPRPPRGLVAPSSGYGQVADVLADGLDIRFLEAESHIGPACVAAAKAGRDRRPGDGCAPRGRGTGVVPGDARWDVFAGIPRGWLTALRSVSQPTTW